MTFQFFPGEHPAMRVFHREDGQKAHALLSVAYAIFELEKALRDGSVYEAEIMLSPNGYDRARLPLVSQSLRELMSFTILESVDFTFAPTEQVRVRKIRTEIDLTPTETVCLFSGGVDSTVGLSLAQERYENVNAVFCAHQDQSKINGQVRALYRREFEPRGTPLRILSVPSVGKGHYAQLRGFLYFVSAAAWMKLLNSSTLVVTECGPTMYQPKFGPLDKVTMTTHPFVVETSRRVIEILLDRPVRILTPFENLTKAEVMAMAPEGLPLSMTHSCISQRFSGSRASHDGVCYGCVVRHLAALAANVSDTDYAKSPISDESASRGNLLSLLRFNLDFLMDRHGMAEYEVGEIEAFGKEDLFLRFALDNYAAIHRLVLERRYLAPDVRQMYDWATAALGGVRLLEERLHFLAKREVCASF